MDLNVNSLVTRYGLLWALFQRFVAADGQDPGSSQLHAEGKGNLAEAQVAFHQPAHAGRQPALPPLLRTVRGEALNTSRIPFICGCVKMVLV